MKALVIYDSMHGNTEKIARAIGDALSTSAKVKVLKAGDAPSSELKALDLLIVGSPTLGGRPTEGIQKTLTTMPAHVLNGVSIASFDTRVTMFIAKLFGYAASRIAGTLEKKGGTLAKPPEGFIVEGREGPLRKGELERAARWAKTFLAK